MFFERTTHEPTGPKKSSCTFIRMQEHVSQLFSWSGIGVSFRILQCITMKSPLWYLIKKLTLPLRIIKSFPDNNRDKLFCFYNTESFC